MDRRDETSGYDAGAGAVISQIVAVEIDADGT